MKLDNRKLFGVFELGNEDPGISDFNVVEPEFSIAIIISIKNCFVYKCEQQIGCYKIGYYKNESWFEKDSLYLLSLKIFLTFTNNTKIFHDHDHST